WVCAANPIETNRWYHYAVTYDAATLELRIFMNGALERVVPMPNGLSLGRQLQVGGDLHGDNWINGYIDDAMVHGRALTPAEVLTLYQREQGQHPPVRLSTDGGVTYSELAGAASSISGAAGTTDLQTQEVQVSGLVQSLSPWTNTLRLDAADLAGHTTSFFVPVVVDLLGPEAVADLLADHPGAASLAVSWTAAPDRGLAGAPAGWRLLYATDPGLVSASALELSTSGVVPGARVGLSLGGLAEATTYYLALLSRDAAGNWSEQSNIASARTFSAFSSADGVAGIEAPEPVTVTVVSSAAAPTEYAIAVASQNLGPVAEFYELTEGLVFAPEAPAQVSFLFDTTEVDPAAVAIYTFDGTAWSTASILNQQITYLEGTLARISGEILHTSLYAPMVRDTLPPLTTFTPTGAQQVLEGRIFVAAPSSGVLAAVDQAPTGGAPAGVAATYFSLDAGAEQAYAGPFVLAEGRRSVIFRSVDEQGNQEPPKTAEVYVDASAPVLDAALDQPAVAIAGGYAVVSPTAVLSLSALDPELGWARSGLFAASYVLDGTTVSLTVTPGDAAAGADIPLGTGLHVLLWRAADRVGHASEYRLRVSVGDATVPALSFAFPRQDEPGLARLAQGTVTVRGSAADDFLASWELRAGSVLLGSGTANASGTLGVWDGAAQAGLVTLMLSASDEAGNAATAELPVFGGAPARVLALGGKSVLSSPRGVAWGPDRVYVADTGKDRIRVFDGAGTLLGTYGAGSGPLKFGRPWGVAVDAAGNIYVADAGKNRVVKLAPDGAYLAEYGGTGVLKKPVAVALLPGKILVGDAQAGELVAFSSEGALLQRVALADGALDPQDPDDTPDDVRPMALAADAAGNVWVADARGGRLLRYTPALDWAQTISGLKRPEGVAVTPSGAVVAVSEAKEHRLSTYDAVLGARLAVWGEQGPIKENKSLPAELLLKSPSQLAFTAGGNLLVADRGNDMIQGFGLPGTPLVAAMAGASAGTHLAAFGDEGFGGGFGAAALDENFALRSVYAFPNPAVGGARPTVHVAVGKADKVTLKFYDVAGTPVHEATLDTPAVVNDEQGPQWAYEYAWAGHIPSGVYLYSVLAEKGGQAPIRRVGKLAVVR
ncbi:MAG: SMP-30/gluconolactonase/LRE family protein, partial [Elusimicrobia bacterium]|nr:SMP-30/gluconolactonase/LRE family protein [Elusimicrobiota bacterium]